MNKNRRERIPIGSISETDREVIAYNDSRGSIYVIECKRCGYITTGAAITFRNPCKKCSLVKKNIQDLRLQIFWKYRYNANLKNVPFEISFEEFKDLIAMSCYYCGQPPSKIWTGTRKHENEVIYNGIDRLINENGYVTGNYVTCCSQCNYMKKAMSLNDFKEKVIQWSKRVEKW